MRSRLLLAVAIALTGCGSTIQTTFTGIGQPEPTATPSAPVCDPAPAWLVEAILRGMTWDGAALSQVFVAPAGEVSGPAIVEGSAFATSWLVVGTIGQQVQKDGVWITNSLDEGRPGLILAVYLTNTARHEGRGRREPDDAAQSTSPALVGRRRF